MFRLQSIIGKVLGQIAYYEINIFIYFIAECNIYEKKNYWNAAAVPSIDWLLCKYSINSLKQTKNKVLSIIIKKIINEKAYYKIIKKIEMKLYVTLKFLFKKLMVRASIL